ncbi:pyridoxal 5'-phosphate synthase glutaminase subunit PdxT, partial [Mesorhizobium sp. BR1-1-5]|nr:pyridoxal 5'-phosphate synthase glutaminase subunit PdxT [Mesorhizobium sp. BR1-1-5]
VMMYPVLAKVRYDETRRIGADRRLLVTSLVLNWIVGPALMFALAWIFLADLPEYRTGLIIVGLARCIAMVLIWNDLACGDREAAAVLVAINSVFQVIAFGALGWFYLQALPSWLGLPTTSAEFSIGAIVLSVLIFLGIPLVAGFLTRILGERAKGRTWYEERFLPKIGPWALYGLLFTIVLLFALQGDVREHVHVLEALGARTRPVRRPADLEGLDGIVLPGGESSVMDRLARIMGLKDPLIAALRDGLPAYGTCAGLIMLAREIRNPAPDQGGLGVLDVAVRRNAFGAQVDSFEEDLDVPAVAAEPVHAVFIRAPAVLQAGEGVEVLASVPASRLSVPAAE